MEPQRSHAEPRDNRASRHVVPYESESVTNSIVRVGDEPIDLISRAYDALDQGILVVSEEGLVSHYNAAYAHLRNIGTTELLGKPLELLDRRHSISMGISPISSRNTVPPSASSNLPGLPSFVAPVKAPGA